MSERVGAGRRLAVVAAALLLLAPGCGPQREAGRIHGVQVLSDKVEDVSSLEAIRGLVLKHGLEAERAAEIFRLTSKFRHQANPPAEHVAGVGHVHDPVKIFNVYGYCQCCCAAAAVEALGRESGMPARGWAIPEHSVAELFYGDRWHMYDGSLINYFVTGEGHVASVEELTRLGPRIFSRAHSSFVDERGWYPARTHRAAEAGPKMYDADRIIEHEHTYTLGYRAAVSLRSGETLVRRWSNRGLYVNADDPYPYHPPMDDTGPTGAQAYLADFYPGYRMGLVGNGVWSYEPDLASGAYRGGIQSETNIAATSDDGAAPGVHLAGAGSGEIVIPFSGSYVILGGTLRGRFLRASHASSIYISVSYNYGRNWSRIWSASQLGDFEASIDLKPHLFLRYQYLLRVELESRDPAGVGLHTLAIAHDIQHSQRTLPLLMSGVNRVTVKAESPSLATMTMEGTLTPSNARNASYRDFHADTENLQEDLEYGILRFEGRGRGSLTFPVRALGPIRAIRFGGSTRMGSQPCAIRLLASDDGGRSWRLAGEIKGPPRRDVTRFVTLDGFTAGSSEVLVRYETEGPGGVQIHTFRVDIDYEDPWAGSRPVRVVYEWTEDAAPKTHSRVVSAYPTTYTIEASGAPIMRSLKVEGL